jgi:hypothetical protein
MKTLTPLTLTAIVASLAVTACAGQTESSSETTSAHLTSSDPDVSTCPANSEGKLNVCHQGRTLSLSYSAASQDLGANPDDYLGSCVTASAPQPTEWTIAIASAKTVAAIRWANVPGATSYRVFYSTKPCVTRDTPDYIRVGASDAPTQKVSQPNLTEGTRYYYAVTAIDANGDGREGPIQMVTTGIANIAAPQNASGTPMAGGTNMIRADLVEGATSYVAYWSHEPGVTPENAYRTVPGPSESSSEFQWHNVGQNPGVTNYYIIAGVKDGQAGPPSAEFAVTATP